MSKNTIVAIIFAIASFLFFVLVLPQYDAVRFVGDAIRSRQALLDQKTASFNNVKKLDSLIKSRREDISKIKSFMPERKQADEIVSSIQKITEQSGIQLSSLTTSEAPVTNETGYKKIFINADVVGTYPAFVNFMKLLERSLRLYDVLEIIGTASTALPGSVNFTVKMNAYYLK